MGLSGWNDPGVWREPSLKGAWFVSPPKTDLDAFEARYRRIYGRAPTSLAAQAYDAAALAISLSADGELEREELMAKDGFVGLNGLFRFVADGTVMARMDWHTGEKDPGMDVFIYSRAGK